MTLTYSTLRHILKFMDYDSDYDFFKYTSIKKGLMPTNPG